MAEGDVVPLATLGTTMPNGMTIERRGILGVDSEGMLCAPDELGLGTDHSGIMILPPAPRSACRTARRSASDPTSVFDLDLTRNRPDCWGYVGIARDLAAQMGIELRPSRPPAPSLGPERTAPVELVDGDKCGRFTSTVLSGVRVGPSAAWMQQRLTAAGLRPISNVVDVSNYVMLELNQPNHAYDLDTLGGGGFRIRSAADGEQMVTLDGETRTFTEHDLLICDAHDRPIGIGGVMGGLDTEITDSTTTVVLEVAWFQQLTVLQTSSRLGLRSEASARYERGCDPYVIDTAIARFAELLGETCPDLVVHAGARRRPWAGLPPEEAIGHRPHHRGQPDPRHRRSPPTTCRPARPDRVHRLGRRRHPHGRDPVVAARQRRRGRRDRGDRPPLRLRARRQDRSEVDGARHALGQAAASTSAARGAARARDLRGDAEPVPRPGHPGESRHRRADDLDHEPAGGRGERAAHVAPARTAPGDLVQRVTPGDRGEMFEIGHVYPPGTGELPDEYEALCVVLAGEEAPAAMAVWREIAAALGVGARIDQGRVPAGLHATRSATLQAGKDRDRRRRRGRPGRPPALRRDRAGRDPGAEPRRDPPPRTEAGDVEAGEQHPSSDLDLAFVAPESVPAERLEKAIRQGAGALLVGLELFDVFRGRGARRRAAQPRLPSAPAGARPEPHRRRHRRRAAGCRRCCGEARRRAPRLTDVTSRGDRPGSDAGDARRRPASGPLHVRDG
jgi:phenylalanyl-tRNA synthetase beta chain